MAAVLRLVIDNALSPRMAHELRADGIDAVHVRDIGMGAAADASILELAQREGRIVVTLDADFSALMAHHRWSTPSIVRFRTSFKSHDRLLNLLRANIDRLRNDLESGTIVTIEDWRIRLRPLPLLGSE